MIAVTCNIDNFQYDIHSLIKAFYPAEDIKISVQNDKELLSDQGLPEFFLCMEDNRITFRIMSAQTVIQEKKSEWSESCTRKEYKNHLKKLIYTSISEFKNETLPWGSLTGIRPTKIAYQMLEEQKTDLEIEDYMLSTYDVSEEKCRLSIDIAKRERKIVSEIHYEKGYSLYIGIPFCPTTCLYCSFTSFPISVYKQKVKRYLDALKKEILFVKEAFRDKILDSIYIGGGTPTTLEPEELRELLSFIHEQLDTSHILEFTVEAGRADSITKEKLMVLKEYGVSRISINPQTMKDETLKLIGRRHSVEQVKESFYLARSLSFDNINMDLILGLPNETKEDVYKTMQEVRKLDPDSLTVHSLAIKRASRLNQWIEENGISCIHNTQEIMNMTMQMATQQKLFPYYLYRQKNMSGNLENVGYAKEGKYGIYNILIMEEKESIVALGAGTVSKNVMGEGRIERCDTVKDVDLYMEQIDEMIARKEKLFSLQ